MDIHGPIERPSFEPPATFARSWKHYGAVAVILIGVLIVTPAWIGLLGWAMLSLFDWVVGETFASAGRVSAPRSSL